MRRYLAVMVFPEGSGDSRYGFDMPDHLLGLDACQLVYQFLASVEGLNFPGIPVSYSVLDARFHHDVSTLTGSGTFTLKNGRQIPFIIMISPQSTRQRAAIVA